MKTPFLRHLATLAALAAGTLAATDATDSPPTTASAHVSLVDGARCGRDGVYKLVRNSHPQRAVRVTIAVVAAPGGRLDDAVVVVAPTAMTNVGCSVFDPGGTQPRQTLTFSILSAEFK